MAQAIVRERFPAMLRHEGTWEGTYTHLAADGAVLDRHASRVDCRFPDDGPYGYVQHNRFTWRDGREQEMVLNGTIRGDRMFWDTETFAGYAWETRDDLILLNLARKDEPGAHFIEVIALGETGRYRSRTWHWFRDGRLYKRTLCDEARAD